MESKWCYACDRTLDVSRFVKDASRKDGRNHKCRSCDTKASAKWRETNREEYNRKNSRHIKRYPERQAARIMVRTALERGEITKSPCIVCGETKVHAHHPDYSKPLKVQWLCIKHHAQAHHA